MRRIVSILILVAMCLVWACPAFAADDTFVPSISYKDGPEIIEAEMGGEDIMACLIVTSIKAATEKTTDIYQSDRDMLLSVYEQIENGTMTLPLDGEGTLARTGGATKKYYVVRELVDVSFRKTTCRENEHTHKEWLEKENTLLTVKFDLGVAADANVMVLTYIDGQWEFIESVTNNGDGTLTCVFEDICPVAFCVEKSNKDPGQTGDIEGEKLILWFVLMIVSTAAILVLAANRRKYAR